MNFYRTVPVRYYLALSLDLIKLNPIFLIECYSNLILSMTRLNSGIFGNFELSARNINLNSSGCWASKIIKNDTEFEPISWQLDIENSIFNFCVDVWVGGHLRTNFSQKSKDPQENSTSFGTNLPGATWRGKKLRIKNRPKPTHFEG